MLRKISIHTLILALVLVPSIVFGAGLVPCDQCTFDDVYPLINDIVEFLLILAVPVGGVIIAIGGFYILTNMGNSSQVSKGWDIVKTAIIGLFIAFAGWLIVKTILYSLGAGWVNSILQ